MTIANSNDLNKATDISDEEVADIFDYQARRAAVSIERIGGEMKFETMDFTGVPIHGETVLDYPTAWAIQKEVGSQLKHHPRCSSVPGWDKLSGPGLLCDCGVVEMEWQRRMRV